MKQTLLILAALATAIACNGGTPKTSVRDAGEKINAELKAIFADQQKSDKEKETLAIGLLEREYKNHRDDSLGLELFQTLLAESWSYERASKELESASGLIRSDRKVSAMMDALKSASATAIGSDYVDIEGPDAVTGKQISISGMLPKDKYLIVDFWASWCPPCRAEITKNLVPLYESGKVQILGIAVWEKSLDDTLGAMKELGISWPVLFGGGRDNSPAVKYGVNAIPTMILISPEGKILARSHSFEDLRPLIK